MPEPRSLPKIEQSGDCVITITELPLPNSTNHSRRTSIVSSGDNTREIIPTTPPNEKKSSPFSLRISDFIDEWTPFLLVFSYFTFSICIYMVCTEHMIAVFWFIYLVTNFYIAGTTVLEAFLSIGPCREAVQAVSDLEKNGFRFKRKDEELLLLDLVIVAYLPNEKDIIMDRICHALNNIVYPVDKIRINILYNTPRPIEPLESQMRALMKQYSQLRVIKVPNSKSKADNLNYFFTLNTGADIIAIYDCDHYPHPHGPRWAIERFLADPSLDIVQGRCIVVNAAENLLTRLVGVEFDKIYAVSHPGREQMMGFGLFCGSNGYWRAPLLREHKMDGEMLTEDIDSALRAFAKGCKATHDLNVVSYELAPVTWAAFWKQRLRWAQGWTQASIKHLRLWWTKPPEGKKRPFISRFGIFSLLFVREMSYYLVTQYFCLILSFIITKFPTSGTALARLIFFTYPVSEWFFFISIICLISTLWITFRVRSEFITIKMVLIFSISYPFYLVLMAIMGLYGHARQVVAYSRWNPTSRS